MHFCSVQTYLTDAATLISDKAITNGAGEAPGQLGQARWCNWFIPPVAIDVVFRLQRQSVCVIEIVILHFLFHICFYAFRMQVCKMSLIACQF